MFPPRLRKYLQITAASGLLCATSTETLAGVWTSDFTITNLYVAGQDNYQYRVYGMPSNSGCASGPSWAYVNDGDPGSKGYIATILASFYAGRPIRVLVEPVGGYCHIIEIFAS